MEILLAHVAATLPDAPAKRREVLAAISSVLPAAHPAHVLIDGLIGSLDVSQKLQAELPLKFTSLKEESA